MQREPRIVVVLATGGTIAGRAESAHDNVGYRAGAVPVGELLAGIPVPEGVGVEAEQVAQLDSKDMDIATWQALLERAAHHLQRREVAGLVVTHGTDTLEETAWLLQRVLAPGKPVVMTAAMRPATSLQADGPQNLADALACALEPGAQGVLAVLAGRVLAAEGLRKAHSWRLDAFDPGEAGALANIEQGRLRRWRDWPSGEPLGLQGLRRAPEHWPWVEIVTSHAAARHGGVDALVEAGVQGLVVAGTGNGSLHHALQAALERARARGVSVALVTRCAGGPVLAGPDAGWPTWNLAAPQARVELMLRLLTQAETPA